MKKYFNRFGLVTILALLVPSVVSSQISTGRAELDSAIVAASAAQFTNFQDSLLIYARRMDVSTDSLVLALFFDDETTGYLDFSGLNNHAVDSNTVIRTDPDSSFNGGGAVAFDGTNFIDITNTLNNSLESTLVGGWEVWVKPVDATPAVVSNIIAFGLENGNRKLRLMMATSGKLHAEGRSSATTHWFLETDNVVFSNNDWTYVALTHNGITPVLYINGLAVPQAFSTSTDISKWFLDLTIENRGTVGAFDANPETEFFNGLMDGLFIWRRAPTADEILSSFLNSKHFSDRMKKLNAKGLVEIDSSYTIGKATVAGNFYQTVTHAMVVSTDSVATTISSAGTYQHLSNTFILSGTPEEITLLTDSIRFDITDSVEVNIILQFTIQSSVAQNHVETQFFHNGTGFGNTGTRGMDIKTINDQHLFGDHAQHIFGNGDVLYFEITDNNGADLGIHDIRFSVTMLKRIKTN